MKVTTLWIILAFMFVEFANATVVIIDFPILTQPDINETVFINGTALDAFKSVANITTVNYSIGEFITQVNGIGNDYVESGGEYWSFYVNDSYASVGAGSYNLTGNETIMLRYYTPPTLINITVIDYFGSPEGNEIYINGTKIGETDLDGKFIENVSLIIGNYTINLTNGEDFITLNLEVNASHEPFEKKVIIDVASRAIQWLINNTNQTGEVGTHAVWGTAFAVQALAVAGENTSLPISYLLANQYGDGGFGYPGFGSDAVHTGACLLAFTANEYKNTDLEKNGNTPLDFLLSHQNNDTGFEGWPGAGSDVDTTSWAILGIISAGYTTNASKYLLSAQNPDGGFGYRGEPSTEDYTAEALLALHVLGINNNVTQAAVEYLKSRQNASGCLSNAWTTAISIMALNAYGEDTSQAIKCLKTLQLPDGGFNRHQGNVSNAPDTAVSALAIKGYYFPLKVLDITPPVISSFTINNNQLETTTPHVMLYLSVSGAKECRYGEGNFWTEWEAPVTTKTWQLSDGYGEKTVKVECRDSSGNTATAQTSILYKKPRRRSGGGGGGTSYKVITKTDVKNEDNKTKMNESEPITKPRKKEKHGNFTKKEQEKREEHNNSTTTTFIPSNYTQNLASEEKSNETKVAEATTFVVASTSFLILGALFIVVVAGAWFLLRKRVKL